MVEDSWGLQVTVRVIPHDAKRIRLACDFDLAGPGSPSARTIVPYSPSRTHLPGHSPS